MPVMKIREAKKGVHTKPMEGYPGYTVQLDLDKNNLWVFDENGEKLLDILDQGICVIKRIYGLTNDISNARLLLLFIKIEIQRMNICQKSKRKTLDCCDTFCFFSLIPDCGIDVKTLNGMSLPQ